METSTPRLCWDQAGRKYGRDNNSLPPCACAAHGRVLSCWLCYPLVRLPCKIRIFTKVTKEMYCDGCWSRGPQGLWGPRKGSRGTSAQTLAGRVVAWALGSVACAGRMVSAIPTLLQLTRVKVRRALKVVRYGRDLNAHRGDRACSRVRTDTRRFSRHACVTRLVTRPRQSAEERRARGDEII